MGAIAKKDDSLEPPPSVGPQKERTWGALPCEEPRRQMRPQDAAALFVNNSCL